MGLLFFDYDGDGDQDLYIVIGGIEKDQGDSAYKDLLLVNDGKGFFKHEENALPKNAASGSCVKAGDIDNDGDLDLFVGTRTIPGEYPNSEPSAILLNERLGAYFQFFIVTFKFFLFLAIYILRDDSFL